MTDAERGAETPAATSPPPEQPNPDTGPDEGGTAAAIRRRLGLDGKPRRWRRRLAIGAAIATLIGGVAMSRGGQDDGGPRYTSATAERGDLDVTVSATGQLEARETVDVGSEVSGRLIAVHADFNDPVAKGQVLAEIETDKLDARVREVSAQLRLARAEYRGAKVERELAGKARRRAETLASKGLLSTQQHEEAVARARRATADAETAKARVSMAAASLEAARNDVARARIVAPIDGIVLARNVEPGQTLASAFQVPVLFQIARDLRELRLVVRVDEADVARVVKGQQATFTVEAHPGERFPSRVVSVRNLPTEEQGVVSYAAVLAVDNGHGKLRPGMTATATIVTEHLADVLLVPNAALRFLPLADAKKEAEQEEKGERKHDDDARHKVWTLAAEEGEEPKPIALAVATGRSDGQRTEIVGGELAVGTEVLVDVEEETP